MDIYLVRHTTPDVATGVCYGQSDLDVTGSFDIEAQRVRDKIGFLKQQPPVYASPLQRCAKLANYLAGDNFTTERGLMELDFGDWEMKRWAELPKEEVNHWMADYVNLASPGGESFQQLKDRVASAIDTLVQKHIDEPALLLVVHAGTIRCALSALLEVPLNEVFRYGLDYGAAVKISYNTEDKSKQHIGNASRLLYWNK